MHQHSLERIASEIGGCKGDDVRADELMLLVSTEISVAQYIIAQPH